MSNQMVRRVPGRNELGLHEVVHDLFRDFFRDFGHSEFWRFAPRGAWVPTADIEVTDDAYIVTLDAPGMERKDITIGIEDGVLTLSGERKSERTDRRHGTVLTERAYGTFSRSFELPGSVDAAAVKAALKDGMLTVTLPKREDARPKRIAVSVD